MPRKGENTHGVDRRESRGNDENMKHGMRPWHQAEVL
jgi:hypothetical protein